MTACRDARVVRTRPGTRPNYFWVSIKRISGTRVVYSTEPLVLGKEISVIWNKSTKTWTKKD